MTRGPFRLRKKEVIFGKSCYFALARSAAIATTRRRQRVIGRRGRGPPFDSRSTKARRTQEWGRVDPLKESEGRISDPDGSLLNLISTHDHDGHHLIFRRSRSGKKGHAVKLLTFPR